MTQATPAASTATPDTSTRPGSAIGADTDSTTRSPAQAAVCNGPRSRSSRSSLPSPLPLPSVVVDEPSGSAPVVGDAAPLLGRVVSRVVPAAPDRPVEGASSPPGHRPVATSPTATKATTASAAAAHHDAARSDVARFRWFARDSGPPADDSSGDSDNPGNPGESGASG